MEAADLPIGHRTHAKVLPESLQQAAAASRHLPAEVLEAEGFAGVGLDPALGLLDQADPGRGQGRVHGQGNARSEWHPGPAVFSIEMLLARILPGSPGKQATAVQAAWSGQAWPRSRRSRPPFSPRSLPLPPAG